MKKPNKIEAAVAKTISDQHSADYIEFTGDGYIIIRVAGEDHANRFKIGEKLQRVLDGELPYKAGEPYALLRSDL